MSTLAPCLACPFTVEAPVVAGPLAVFPLIADRRPSLHYVSLTEALTQGATLTELPQGEGLHLIASAPQNHLGRGVGQKVEHAGLILVAEGG